MTQQAPAVAVRMTLKERTGSEWEMTWPWFPRVSPAKAGPFLGTPKFRLPVRLTESFGASGSTLYPTDAVSSEVVAGILSDPLPAGKVPSAWEAPSSGMVPENDSSTESTTPKQSDFSSPVFGADLEWEDAEGCPAC